MSGILSQPYFHDEEAAFAKLESIVWPNGPVCPKCGAMERIYTLKGVKDKKGRVRPGLKKCGHCRTQFTVRVGTVFESSHVPLHLWLQAAYLMCASKKGISSNQLHRTLGITLKSAWFLSHRLREAMRDGSPNLLGGEGKTVEADETYIGPPKYEYRNGKWHGKRGVGGKRVVVTLVERDGRARSIHFDKLKMKDMRAFMLANTDTQSHLRTDEAPIYKKIGTQFASHETVNHSKDEYVRGDAYTNTAEGFFSIFKRGMRGVYQHCSEQHLQRYLAEFDFRYNHRIARGFDDGSRADFALRGIVGKRLTYRDSC